LVHSEAVSGPATHAIVIGLDAYPHLLGGVGELSDDHDGMKQLSSPGVSAREICEWLITKLHDPNKPLATVALLLGQSTQDRFKNPKNGKSQTVQAATMENVERALLQWKARGDEDAENRLIFFFCGHGIAQGTDTSLLLADYGQKPDNPLDGAIDFRLFHLGMHRCAARQQCYFVDACRASSDTLIEALGYAGRPIVMPQGIGRDLREAPVFYSTVAGQDAYGREGKLSPFTDALIRSLNGAGSDDNEGDWRVSTTRLKEATDYFVKQITDVDGHQAQVPATGNLTTFFIHYLDAGPEVPVFVGCRPEAATAEAELICRFDGAERARRAPASKEWELTLPVGTYEFVAEFAAGSHTQVIAEKYVRPVYRRIPLDVTP
jgi:hypothetical protein